MDTFLLGLRGARITDFKMTENRDFLKDHPDIDPVFLKADSILVRINPLMILLGQVYIKEMTINNPRYQLIRDKQGNWNFDDLSEAQDSKLINWLRVKNLSINNAAGRIVDHSALNAPATANVNNVDIRIDDFTIGEIFDLNIKAATPGSNKQNFIMKGRAGPLQLKQKNEQIPVDADLNIIDLPIVSYNRYAFPENSPVFPISGNIDVDLHLKGDAWSGMTLTGSLDLENMVFQELKT